jgi:mannose-1-phosphate guanylyltransferase
MVMNTHHHSDKFSAEINEFPIEVFLVHEASIRGTAGGIRGAGALLGPPPILVWNGDVLAAPPVAALLAGALDGGLCLGVAPRAPGEGTVGLDDLGRLARLRGEVFGWEAAGGDYVGIAAIGHGALAGLPREGCLVGDVLLPLLRSGGTVTTVPVLDPWRDIGSTSGYHAANLDWLARFARGKPWVHESARVAKGVELRETLVGADAVVEGSGFVERCVVWPGARAVAPLSNVIVTTGGHVVPA